MTTKNMSITTATIEDKKQQLFHKLYSKLNAPQREAVLSVNGALLVLAGAGSGKTTVLVNRIAQILLYGDAYYTKSNIEATKELNDEADRLLLSGTKDEISEFLKKFAVNKPQAYNVLCLTFTNKAASEFKARLEKLLGTEAHDIWAGTFHSVCVRILRRSIDRLGYKKDFTIYDADDTKKLITECMKELDIDDRILAPRNVMQEISHAKESCISVAAYRDSVGQNFKKKEISDIYALYQKNLMSANAVDFDDLIYLTVRLFTEHPDILEQYKSRFKYVLADEYQDTNRSQSMLIELLSSGYGNICVVGDDDQSIYGFRGATVENILEFDSLFPNVKTIRLEQNYRSTKNILAAANGLINNNTTRKGKTLHTENDEGKKVLVKKHYTQSEEATYLMNLIRHRVVYEGAKYSDFAILYRLNEQANALELIFSRSKVPYRIFGGTRFYDRKEIKDLTAYLALIYNSDDNTRLKRIINVPKRQIGSTTIAAITEIASRNGESLYNIVRNAALYPELSKAAASLTAFSDMIEELKSIANNTTIDKLVQALIERTGYRNMLSLDPDEKERSKVAFVDELISTAVEFEAANEDKSLGAFLEQIALVSDVDNYDAEADAVMLMTMHNAKGLEFPVVFLPGFEEGIFPSQRAIDNGELEEERRLAYVALTRAKKELQILHTNTRLLYGRTASNRRSRFIDELPPEYVEFEEMQRALSNIRPAETRQRYSRSLESFEKNTKHPNSPVIKKPEVAKATVIPEGAVVEHKIFGRGIVEKAEPMGGDVLYTISFETQGVRKLMGNFAKLEQVIE